MRLRLSWLKTYAKTGRNAKEGDKMKSEEICKAGVYAQDVADCCKVAYWTKADIYVMEMQIRDAHSAFIKLADAMGYRVELKE